MKTLLAVAFNHLLMYSASQKSFKSYLKVDELQVGNEDAQQPTVVELLGQLGHSFCLGLLFIGAIQDLLHGHQALRHLLCGLQQKGHVKHGAT